MHIFIFTVVINYTWYGIFNVCHMCVFSIEIIYAKRIINVILFHLLLLFSQIQFLIKISSGVDMYLYLLSWLVYMQNWNINGLYNYFICSIGYINQIDYVICLRDSLAKNKINTSVILIHLCRFKIKMYGVIKIFACCKLQN